jgi:hypothetical protein
MRLVTLVRQPEEPTHQGSRKIDHRSAELFLGMLWNCPASHGVKNDMITPILFLLPLLAASPDDLTVKITTLDAEVFDAYNRCDLTKFGSFFADDLEFYHDQGGLSVGRQALVEGVKNNICGKVHRDSIPGTLAVYPLKGYGAVETGIHLFCDPKSTTGKCGDGSGVARFIHLWQNKDGGWKITRVISYDHCNDCSTSIPPNFRVAASK